MGLRLKEQRSPSALCAKTLRAAGLIAGGRRWLGCYIPLRGCANLATLSTAKIARRRTSCNFQTGSEAYAFPDSMFWA